MAGVPNTNTFGLSDVIAAVESHAGSIPDTLNDCFTKANPSYFNVNFNDDAYAPPYSMLRFRDYNGDIPMCGTSIPYEGGQAFPFTQKIKFTKPANGIKTAISFTGGAYNVPDRFVVVYDNNIVLDTGYIGHDSYAVGGSNRSTFTMYLNGKVAAVVGESYPDTTKYPGSLSGYPDVLPVNNPYVFELPTTYINDYLTVYIYAPLPNTGWDFACGCPVPTSAMFTTPGVYYWTAPAGVTSVTVHCIGAGGNGAYVNNNDTAGGGGGGGGYARSTLAVTPNSSYQVVVGAPGDLNDGASVFIRSFLDAVIGAGGKTPANNSVDGASGGTDNVGIVAYRGGSGGDGITRDEDYSGSLFSGGGGSGAGTTGAGNHANSYTPGGAKAEFGGAGGLGVSEPFFGARDGNPGTSYGGGGSGGLKVDRDYFYGGRGSNGMVLIEW